MKSFRNSSQRLTYENSTETSPNIKSKRSSINRFILTAQQVQPTTSVTTSIFLPKSKLKQQSITQRQIYSHEVISSIMRKRQSKSIVHQIGNFDPQIQLYSKPIAEKKQQSNVNNPQASNDKNNNVHQGNFQESEYSQKIHKFNDKLNKDKPLSERIEQLKKLGIQKARSLRPKSAQSNNSTNNSKRVSVSGLVTYNFQSVNARKNLGFKMQNDQQELAQQLKNLTTKNKCCNQRHYAIMNKKACGRARVQSQIKKAILIDFQTDTHNFLQNFSNETRKDKKIYGEKAKKLDCIKQLMRDQNLNFEEAEHIIQVIQKKKQVIQKPKVSKPAIDEQKQLANRKKVQQRHKVMLRQLYFSD